MSKLEKKASGALRALQSLAFRAGRRGRVTVVGFCLVFACSSSERRANVERSVEPQGAPTPAVDSANVFFIGHSLVNFMMPTMTQAIAESLGVRMTWDAQVQSGAALKVNWEEHASADGADARLSLPSGRYDVVVMTEAVRLDDMIRWMEPVKYGGLFYELATKSNPSARVLFYTTWHERDEVRKILGCARSGDFRSHIAEDRPKWEGIVDGIVKDRRGRGIDIVPGGDALARLMDEMEAGRVPALTDVDALFIDNIHLSPLGNYFIGLVQFSTIFRRSPVGATHRIEDPDGRLLVEVSPATAASLQELAYRVVVGHPRSGVRPPDPQ